MKSNFWGAVLLIAGTCIGGGMLALPVDTAEAGFFPSLFAMIICWAFMTLTALLIVEANLWLEEGAHIMTMASRLLGRPGKWLSLLLFLFMGYASMIAYTTAGSDLIHLAYGGFFQGELSRSLACLAFTVIFGVVLLFSTKVLGKINGLLVTGMIGAYFLLIIMGITKVDFLLLQRQQWKEIVPAFPILLTIFSFQMIVPSLIPYVQRDISILKKTIVVGTSIPFLVYLLWQWIILGSVPFNGEYGLLYALQEGKAATDPFRRVVQSRWLSKCSDFFSFFAIVTSFLGIGLSLIDFLADSMKISKKGTNKFLLAILVVIPSLLFAIWFPRAFLTSLEVSGGYGDAILNGLLPVAMVYSGRYVKKLKGNFSVAGGKTTLFLAACFAVFIIVIQTIQLVK